MWPCSISRLIAPKSVAVIGGGAWGEAVIAQLQKAGFPGPIWPIHPAKTEIAGLRAYTGVPDLPSAPDAAFVGINREATIGAESTAEGASATAAANASLRIRVIVMS